MIKKSLISTLVLLVLFGLFIQIAPFSIEQHKWKGNIINAEKFLFDEDKVDNIIVGSSLAIRMKMDSLDKFYNLSFGGHSVYDGLNLLRNKENLPKHIFIESNLVDRAENPNFTSIVSNPVLNTMKKTSKVFRTDKQPLALVGDRFVGPVVGAFFYKIIYKLKYKSGTKEEASKPKPAIDNSLFDKMVDMQLKDYDIEIDPAIMDKHFMHLKNHVTYFESKGVKIHFFEMPIHQKLINSPRAQYLRNRVQKDFPNNNFIPVPKNAVDYKTTDGLHLNAPEAKIYTSYFKEQSQSVSN